MCQAAGQVKEVLHKGRELPAAALKLLLSQLCLCDAF